MSYNSLEMKKKEGNGTNFEEKSVFVIGDLHVGNKLFDHPALFSAHSNSRE